MLEKSPRACSVIGGIPAFGGDVGSLGEPEGPLVEQFDFGRKVKNGHALLCRVAFGFGRNSARVASQPVPGVVRDYNDVTIRLSGRYIFICRIGNEKATVYFQPIALEYRISNNLLQDTKIFQNRQIYPKSRCMQKLAF